MHSMLCFSVVDADELDPDEEDWPGPDPDDALFFGRPANPLVFCFFWLIPFLAGLEHLKINL